LTYTNRGFARQPYWMARQFKLFALERTFVPVGKRIYCSCHPIWLPCKTSIAWSGLGLQTGYHYVIDVYNMDEQRILA